MIEALTIDRAQGRDVDVVVVSFARANERRDPGSLLADARRLNVALTRARGKLVLVGCGRTLVKSPVLDRVVGLVVREGWMQRLTREDALGVRGVGVGVGGDGDAAAAAAGES
jgi:DNA replication ATP-dependent helicase Dna2